MTRRPSFLDMIDRKGWAFLAILAAAAVLVPAANLLLPPTSSLHVPTYAVALMGKYLSYALLAVAFGWFAFRSRVTGVYLSIITQAMTFALLLAFFRNDMGFGGNNGLTDFKDILGFNVQAASTRLVLFLASALALAGGYLLCRFIVTSKLGKVLVAIRGAESRTRFLGYKVEHYKLAVFTLSAILAGVAG